MKRISRQNRVAACVFSCVFLVVVIFAMPGCGDKKPESAYGPGNEWVDDMRVHIQEKIEDPVKATDLLAVVDKIEASLIQMDSDVQDYYNALSKLDRDYHSTRDDFQQVVDNFNAARHRNFEALIGCLFEMKTVAGREDWKLVSDIDKTLYEDWQRTYQP